ncbi:hypothetical protein M4I32_01935 [Microbacterium sp. LRZ72]|uniref:hypothetical protein n=1 Tax=Microbacterium sp. LRZ72 TaxID=2942481 RepID=UPI0029B66745|nr:hypothetical protein [Microbacterium sp. LRZ72]MDX2375556.1 hypothetical protein [Microbacterium sp. LRZ72]
MPRSNRRRPETSGHDGFERMLAGWKRAESRRGVQWTVQPMPAGRAAKEYTCPGCGGTIGRSVAHVVVWRADGVLGDAADLAGRRHWHSACWRVA